MTQLAALPCRRVGIITVRFEDAWDVKLTITKQAHTAAAVTRFARLGGTTFRLARLAVANIRCINIIWFVGSIN